MKARIFRRRRGDVLQPERFNENVVRGLKSKPREWSGQYEQEPSPASGVIFNPAWWRYYKPRELPECELIVISVDCAFKSAAHNDLVSIQKWGQLGPRSYLIDRHTEHLGFAGTKAAIRAMQQHGRPASAILIEDKANGSAIIEELKADPDFGAAVIAIEPSGGKESRAHAASTEVEAGNVYLPEDAPWLATFLRTTSAFPGVKHDDDVDSMTQFLNWRRGRSLSLGLVDLIKRKAREIAEGIRDTAGELVHKPQPKPLPIVARPKVEVPVVVDNFANWLRTHQSPPCPACKSTATTYNELRKLRCNQCAAIDGIPPPPPAGSCCGSFLPQVVGGGGIRCGSCGAQTMPSGIVAGLSRADYDHGVGRRSNFGR